MGCPSAHLADDLFLGVPRLRSLSISQMPALQRLEFNFFSHLVHLEKFSLTQSGLKEMPGDGLCQLAKLQVLDLSQNWLHSARLGIFLPRPADQPCQLGELIMLDISGNSIQVLAENDLGPFPALRQLGLRANGLVEIQPDAFLSGPIPLLHHLDLSSNRLSELPSGLPQGILQLDLSNNQFHSIPPAAAQLAGLIRLNLSGNSIVEGGGGLQSSALEHLDLSWNNLKRIPVEIFANSANSLKTLRMAGNGIGQLEAAQMVTLSALHELDISSNRLNTLPFGSFNGFSELAILNLANNSIQQIDADAFQELGQTLHTLIMSQNMLAELPMAISRLNRIKRIDLSRNQISRAHKFVLNKLLHLGRLDLSQNELESVDSYVFSGCEHLQELNLRANKIHTISPDAFDKCPKLKRLDLAENQLESIGPALTLLKSLRIVNLTGNFLEEMNWTEFPLNLIEILANGNKIKRIGILTEEGGDGGEKQFDGGTEENGRMLKRLELKRNGLSEVLVDSLPSSLEELDLSENQLENLAKGTFNGLEQLKMVNLRWNKLRTIPGELFDLAIRANAPFGRIWIAKNPLECNCEMGWLLNATANGSREGGGGNNGVRDIDEAECLVPLSGQRRPITQMGPSDFLCPYTQMCEPGCPCCQYQNCDCKSRCQTACECFWGRHLATNVVKCIGNGGASKEELNIRELPMKASHIYISGLHIPILEKNTFSGRDRLLELHINSSKIQKIQPSAFNTLINLKSLHLANNSLTAINGDEANRTLNIRYLNLANNKINAISTNLSEMVPQLEEIHLIGNALEELPYYLKNTSAGDPLSQLYLAGNPFRCDCSANGRFDTPQWLEVNRQRVADSKWVHCVENVTRSKLLNDTTILSTQLPNFGDDLFMMPMLEFFIQENRTICVPINYGVFGVGGPFDTLLFLLAMITVLIVLPVLILFAFRPHWFSDGHGKLRSQDERNGLLNKNNKNNSNSLSSTHSPNATSGESPIPTELTGQRVLPNECDIFICYAKKDETLIQEFFCPLGIMGYILCFLHHCEYYREDSAYFSDDLNNLIKNSRVLVLFLTREFLQKDWNRPQLTSSFKLDKKQNESRRILIIMGNDMDQADLATLPSELGNIIRRDGYLKQRDPLLMNELSRILPILRSCSPISETSQSHIYSEYGQIPPAPSEFV